MASRASQRLSMRDALRIRATFVRRSTRTTRNICALCENARLQCEMGGALARLVRADRVEML